MQNILRRQLLALMIGATAISFTAPIVFDTPAFAKNGADDGAGHDANDDHGGSSGSSSGSDDGAGHDANEDHGGHSGSSNDSDDGAGHDTNDDHGGSSSSDDDSNGSGSHLKNRSNSSASSTRPTAIITLSSESLSKIQAGTHVVVDQLGRTLEIDVSAITGQIRAKPHGGDAKRNPGPITDISVVSIQ